MAAFTPIYPTRKFPPEHAVSDLLGKVDAFLKADQYRELSEAFVAFHAANPGLNFFVEEALPAHVADHVLSKTGAASAFTTFTLQNPNWAVDLQRAAFDPKAFSDQIVAIEETVAALVAAAKKPA
ncbi:hypothetical protein V5F77_16360 [Xanthobacter sp. DSM 24535]|uniref:hypothetical protein n=1 Tax=Roseixanthobacter psychrophilus TaxID=3119917 RepID=UPI003726F7CA